MFISAKRVPGEIIKLYSFADNNFAVWYERFSNLIWKEIQMVFNIDV
jgi:hypothetical protein